MNDVDILLLVVATDIVRLPHFARGQHSVQGAGVVLHIEPVTHLITFAVHR
ncbi:hypothetical protein D9M69_655300 [compost metagenome]